jgi:nuclear transcription Y subunit beta
MQQQRPPGSAAYYGHPPPGGYAGAGAAAAAVAAAAAAMPRPRPKKDGHGDDSVREQDRFLPVANISRIMKRVLPPDAKAAKEAKEAIQESVSELISFITSEASDKCSKEKRKTINGDDVLWAMGTLGFEHYVEPLRLCLERYREVRAEGVELEAAGAGGGGGGGAGGKGFKKK